MEIIDAFNLAKFRIYFNFTMTVKQYIRTTYAQSIKIAMGDSFESNLIRQSKICITHLRLGGLGLQNRFHKVCYRIDWYILNHNLFSLLIDLY